MIIYLAKIQKMIVKFTLDTLYDPKVNPSECSNVPATLICLHVNFLFAHETGLLVN